MHGFFVLSRICEHAYNAHSLPRLVIFSLSYGSRPLNLARAGSPGWRALTFTNHERRHPASAITGDFSLHNQAIFLKQTPYRKPGYTQLNQFRLFDPNLSCPLLSYPSDSPGSFQPCGIVSLSFTWKEVAPTLTP